MPESKNEENLEVNIVGAKNNYICSECRGLSVTSSPETRAYVTDVTDRVSLPATSSKINSIHSFESENFNVSVTIHTYTHTYIHTYIHTLFEQLPV